MSFEKIIRIPLDRVGALIGKSGGTKSKIEKACAVELEIDGDSGEIMIRGEEEIEKMKPFKAMEIVTAIGRGFSPANAMKLLEGENTLHVIDLREFVGKSSAQVERIKGRIIGLEGKSKKRIGDFTNSDISVYGQTVAIIGPQASVDIAAQAVELLAEGKMHSTVFTFLKNAMRKVAQQI